MYRRDIDIKAVIQANEGIGQTAICLYSILNRLVCTSANRGIKDKKGIPFCYASKRRLAEMMKKSVRTIERAIAALKKAGLIIVQRTTRNAHIYITGYESSPRATQDRPGQTAGRAAAAAAAGCPEQRRERERAAQRAQGGSTARITGADPGEGSQEQSAQQDQRRGRVGSGSVKNGGSNNSHKSINNNQSISINHIRNTEQRRKVYDYFEDAWGLCRYYPPEYANEQKKMYSVAGIIADVAAGPREMNINGGKVTGAEFLNMVIDLKNIDVTDVLNRVKQAQKERKISDIRRYIVAALYNHGLWKQACM